MKAFPALLATLLLPVTASSLDWPNWRGPDHNGISRETLPAGLPEPLPIAWKADVGIGFCTVSVVGDRVLTMGNRDERDRLLTIFRASPEGFQPRLKQKILDGKCWTTPVLSHGRLYCRTAEGDLAAVLVEAD